MKKELVTLEERLWIAKNAVKMMGKAVQYKVIDLDKVADRMKEQRLNHSLSPYVEIQPISEDMHKMPNRMTTFQKDPITGVFYGIALDQDEFGNIKWQKIQLNDSLSLNLDRLPDAKVWAVLRFHPDIEGSPWQIQNPYYKVYDPVANAIKEGEEIDLMKTAFDRVDMLLDNPKEMVLFARYLGEELVENSNFRLVKGALLRYARNNPYEFNQKWSNKSKAVAEYFETARALGIVTNDINRGFLFRNISLGLTAEEAIRMLGKDPNILSSISTEITDKDMVVKTIQRELDEQPKEGVKKGKKEKVPAGADGANEFE